MLNLESGLAAFVAEDYTKAFSLLKPMAEQGDAEAQCLIANMYHLGLGLERSVSEAISWYVRSAEQGYGLASNNLGGIFMAGDEGVAPDRELAKKWYRKAKEQGFLHVPSNEYLESRS